MKGLFLQGGGAKGAFQAGVIYGLYENGFKFDIISATSIGAINAYFIYTDSVDELREIWTSGDLEKFRYDNSFGKVIENKKVIDYLGTLEGINKSLKSIFVNYVSINKSTAKHVAIDLLKLNSKEEILKAIRYSSLLPFNNSNNLSEKQLLEKFNSEVFFNRFREDVHNGLYDGYNLDGGIIDNNFLTPFINNRVDELYLITLKNNYEIPDYISKVYDLNKIYVFEPITQMKPNYTVKFEHEFCSELFNEGYRISKEIKI